MLKQCYFNQKYTIKLFISFKWPILAFQLRGKSRFSRIPQKKFITLITESQTAALFNQEIETFR